MLRVAAFTGGIDVPSARFRVRQYLPYLRALDIDMREFSAPLSAYPPSNRGLRLLWGIGSIIGRAPSVVRSFGYELTLLQREMLSTFLTWEPFTRTPRVLDVDDAIWLNLGRTSAKKIANLCKGVICGNDFLAEYFTQYNKDVRVLPTGIDTDRFRPRDGTARNGPLVVGWSGTSSGFGYLYDIEHALSIILKENRHVVLRVVSDKRPQFDQIPLEKFEFVVWSADKEVEQLQEMDIGIMPITDSEWTRGKCSFKMLSYMACGLPVVVSPIGMNQQVLSLGKAGLEASTSEEWVDTLNLLIMNNGLREEMGKMGREVTVQNFSVRVLAPRLAEMLVAFSEG